MNTSRLCNELTVPLWPNCSAPQAVSRQIAKYANEAAEIFPILDQHLGNHQFVAGTDFTMGDIPLGAVAYRYFNIDIERPSLPNMEAWYERLCQRPAYQQHVMRFFGTNPSQWHALERAGIG